MKFTKEQIDEKSNEYINKGSILREKITPTLNISCKNCLHSKINKSSGKIECLNKLATINKFENLNTKHELSSIIYNKDYDLSNLKECSSYYNTDCIRDKDNLSLCVEMIFMSILIHEKYRKLNIETRGQVSKEIMHNLGALEIIVNKVNNPDNSRENLEDYYTAILSML